MNRSISGLAIALAVSAACASAAPPADFTVKTAGDTQSFTLSQAKGKYVALHFLLKTECPLCLRHTRDYAKKAPSLPEVEQVFLKPDAEAEVSAWAAQLKGAASPNPPSIYRDADAKLADAYGVPNGYAFHGQTVHYPALILLGPDGKEVWRYVGKSNSDRASFETLQAKVAELKTKKN